MYKSASGRTGGHARGHSVVNPFAHLAMLGAGVGKSANSAATNELTKLQHRYDKVSLRHFSWQADAPPRYRPANEIVSNWSAKQ